MPGVRISAHELLRGTIQSITVVEGSGRSLYQENPDPGQMVFGAYIPQPLPQAELEKVF